MRIECENVGVRLQTRDLLRDVSLSFAGRELAVIVGPNGAGKSSLLKVLSGHWRASEGVARMNGRPLARWQPRELARHRAVLPQSSSIPFAFTAHEIVALGRSPHGDTARSTPIVEAMMRRTDTLHLASRSATTLSGGELQRVHLARVLTQLEGDPTGVLLLDEPTSNLDPLHQHIVLRIAHDFAKGGGTVVAVLHDFNLALQYADRVIVLAAGSLAADGPPEQTLTPDLLASVFGVRAALARHPFAEAPAMLVSGPVHPGG
jgi:iron complex transport system ATP-binding protein